MIHKSKVDTNNYIFKDLKNGIKALIVQNSVFTKSSCALTVEIGSFDEPDEFPGLAHFLEHMLFMGTEKYPGENMFGKFISMHNGYSNAYTSDEYTTYYCDVDSTHLFEMADMFSQFFISPIFKKDTVDREISAVNSEYLNSLNNKFFAAQALYTDLMNDNRVEKRFSCGNSETLRRVGSLEAVIDLWKTRYSSHLMSLVICGSDPVEELEKVLALFESIPCRKEASSYLDTNEFKGISDIFRPEVLSKIVQFKPVDNKNELQITTFLPPLRNHFKTNPIGFISFLITKKETGGLLHCLKSQKLASEISFTHTYFKKYTEVKITVSLTDKGLDQHRRVLGIVKSYLDQVQIEPGEYSRLAREEGEEFDFKQIETPIDIAEGICPDILFYPPEYVLKYDYLFEVFDQELIESCVKSIRDTSKWIILLANPNGTFDSKEKYYSVEYKISDELCNIELDSSVKWNVHSNIEDQFIDTIQIISPNERYFRRETFENGEVNLVFDGKFNVPKSIITVMFESPEIRANPLKYLAFFFLLNDSFQERYSRQLFNLHIDISVHLEATGIAIEFDGFSAKIIEIAMMFFNYPNTFKSPDEVQRDLFGKFDVIKQEIIDMYSGIVTSSPYKRISEVFNTAFTSARSSESLLEEAKSLTVECLNVGKDLYTKILAVGNIEYEQVKSLFDSIKSNGTALEIKPVDLKDPIEFETPDLFNNSVALFYKVNEHAQARSIPDHNEAESFESIEPNSYDYNTAIGQFIYQIANEKFFNDLRTVEELGYVVCTFVHSFLSAEYFIFLVQCEKTVEFLEDRIRRFAKDLTVHISEMDDEQFESHRESLIGFYDEPILNLHDLNKFVMNQLTRGFVDLNYNEKMIHLVTSLKKSELVDFELFREYIRVNSKRKQ